METNIFNHPTNKLAGGWTITENDLAAIDRLLSPRSIVMYGASDKSNWSQAIYASTRSFGFSGKMYAVNRRGTPAHGLPGFVSCRAIGEEVDAAFIMVPTDGVLEAIEDIASAGIKSAIVLTSGFAEMGSDGQALQQRLVDVARQNGVAFLGPNSIGYADITRRIAITATRPTADLEPGRIALISQSGAVTYEIMQYALQQGIGLSFLAAVGNEAMVDFLDLIEGLLDRDEIQSFAVFVETIRNPDRFGQVALKASKKNKPIVMLKVGTSELSAAVAQAHTGSLIGDDRVLSAVCDQYSVIRVSSIEQLINTAALLVHTGKITKPGIAAVSLSGGTCSLVADAAERAGLSVPPFAPETMVALRAVLPSFASTINPLDATGMAMNDPELWGKCLEIISKDPEIGLTICAGTLMPLGAFTAQTGEVLRRIGEQAILLSSASQPLDLDKLKTLKVPAAFSGLDVTMSAIAAVQRWSVSKPRPHLAGAYPAKSWKRPKGEREVLNHLSSFGVPTIPSVLAQSAQEAIQAANTMSSNTFALKIASPDIQHKTEVGGVMLHVQADAVAKAFDTVLANAKAARPGASIDGVLVSPMRAPSTELIVGTLRDPSWGPAIVVGLGGIWVEAFKDTALRLLPVDRQDVLEMLDGLQANALLKGYRGTPAADLEKLAEVVVGIGQAALALGPDLAALEVNPLRLCGSEIEALDGLAVYAD